MVVAEIEASEWRPDLRAAGIGHGRYGFSVPFETPAGLRKALHILVRVKDGPVLTNGEAEIGGPPPEADRQAPAFQAFVAAVLGQGAEEDTARPTPAKPPRIHFIVYSATGQEPAAGAPEYSYGFALRAFAPLLAQIGSVQVVSDPVAEVDAIHFEHLERGETSLFLSFAPPHQTVMGLRCPTVPVIAWEFPTIPAVVWDDERRHDWRWVLRQTGRAITLSSLAARAIKASMGVDFPVVAIPPPVWDRLPYRSPSRPLHQGARLALNGHVVDIRGQIYDVDRAVPPTPSAPLLPFVLELDGVVFTSVLPSKGAGKTWRDITTAFISALGDAPDATLVLKMSSPDLADWWWDFFDMVLRAPDFACRIVVVQGQLDEEGYAALVRASHWVVNASRAEGLCPYLLEFMCAGRPAVAPGHTAMADYIDPRGALVVASDEESCSWPHDTRNAFTSTFHRVEWPSLRDRLAEAYDITRRDPERYGTLSQGAAELMRTFCSDEVVMDKLDAFLGLSRHQQPGAAASDLVGTICAA